MDVVCRRFVDRGDHIMNLKWVTGERMHLLTLPAVAIPTSEMTKFQKNLNEFLDRNYESLMVDLQAGQLDVVSITLEEVARAANINITEVRTDK